MNEFKPGDLVRINDDDLEDWFKPGDLVRINDDDLEDCHGKLALIQSSAYNLDPACPTVRYYDILLDGELCCNYLECTLVKVSK
jgi:hypothetical protein